MGRDGLPDAPRDAGNLWIVSDQPAYMLAYVPERAEAIMRELFRAGFQRSHCMLGVDAAQGIDHLPWWRPARATWLSRWGRLEPIIACAASHLRIYADARSRQTAALNFEDDAWATAAAPSVKSRD